MTFLDPCPLGKWIKKLLAPEENLLVPDGQMGLFSSPAQGCQPPTSSNIENWWGRGWKITSWRSWCHLWKKCLIITNSWWHKIHEKDVVGIVTFDLIGLLLTNHIIFFIFYLFIFFKKTFYFYLLFNIFLPTNSRLHAIP